MENTESLPVQTDQPGSPRVSDEQSHWCQPCKEITDWVRTGKMYRCTGRGGKCTNESRLAVSLDGEEKEVVVGETPEERHRRRVREYMRKKRGTKRYRK